MLKGYADCGITKVRVSKVLGFRDYLKNPKLSKTYLFCRVPRNPIFGFIIRTYRKVGFGFLR